MQLHWCPEIANSITKYVAIYDIYKDKRGVYAFFGRGDGDDNVRVHIYYQPKQLDLYENVVETALEIGSIYGHHSHNQNLQYYC